MSDGDRAVAGTIFDVQRYCIHDGPGIRTTVFLKGCPLRCRWCHNPESWSPGPDLLVSPQRCLGCGQCVEACPAGAHRLADGRHAFDRGLCRACGRCAEVCPSEALELAGRSATAGAVLDEVLRDEPFFVQTGGGLTLSGGEPALQPDFSAALLRLARQAGLNTAVETAGWGDADFFRAILPLTDLFLFDLKADASRHVELTGVPLAPILDTLRLIASAGGRLWLRLPLAPGVNDTPDHFAAIAQLVRSLPGIERVGVLPYHALGRSKHVQLGSVDPLADVALPDAVVVNRWLDELRNAGVDNVAVLGRLPRP